MSESQPAKISGLGVYQPPRVTKESLDSGGNYVNPYGSAQMSPVNNAGMQPYGSSPLGDTVVE